MDSTSPDGHGWGDSALSRTEEGALVGEESGWLGPEGVELTPAWAEQGRIPWAFLDQASCSSALARPQGMALSHLGRCRGWG